MTASAMQGLSRGGFDGGVNQTIFDEFQDIFGDFFGFEDIFGGRRGRSRSQRGADLRYDMKLSFEEAASGVNTKIRIPRLEFCEVCNGTGAKAGTGVVACVTCGGRGQVHYQQGFFTISRTCPDCRGAGQIVREMCPDCRGKGRIERSRTIDLRIPPGVDSNTRLRIPGEGEPGGNSGPAGDLYVVLDVKPHPYFERRDADLYCTVPVSIVQAALGTEIVVPGLNGEETVKIPEGTQTGEIIRLKGKGHARSARRRQGRPVREHSCRDPHETDARAAAAVRTARGHAARRKSARSSRFFAVRKGKRYFWVGRASACRFFARNR